MLVGFTAPVVKTALCELLGSHSVFVRPKPTTWRLSAALGAVLDTAIGAPSVTGWASRAITRSRSVRGSSSAMARVWLPMVAVVAVLGAPEGTVLRSAGLSAKQLAAESSHCGATRVAVQEREPGWRGWPTVMVPTAGTELVGAVAAGPPVALSSSRVVGAGGGAFADRGPGVLGDVDAGDGARGVQGGLQGVVVAVRLYSCTRFPPDAQSVSRMCPSPDLRVMFWEARICAAPG